MRKTRIVIADDHSIIRTSLRNLLSLEEDIIVLGEAENGEQALRLVEDLSPDILLLDMEMPDLNGLQVTAYLKVCQSPVIVLIVSAQDDPEYIRCVLSCGASGYLTKAEVSEYLPKAIREMMAGAKEWLSPRTADLVKKYTT